MFANIFPGINQYIILPESPWMIYKGGNPSSGIKQGLLEILSSLILRAGGEPNKYFTDLSKYTYITNKQVFYTPNKIRFK